MTARSRDSASHAVQWPCGRWLDDAGRDAHGYRGDTRPSEAGVRDGAADGAVSDLPGAEAELERFGFSPRDETFLPSARRGRDAFQICTLGIRAGR